jgi:hypothetical protein
MAKISDDFPKLLVVLDYGGASHEGECDYNLPIHRVGSNVYVTIGSFIVSEGESRQFYALVFPLAVNYVLLVEQSARYIDKSNL